MSTPTTSRPTAVIRRLPAGRRSGRGVALVGLAAAVLALTGCALPWSSIPTADSPQVHTGELSGADRTPSGGTTHAWRRAGQPEPVAAADLPHLRAALDDLVPADRGGGCPADLGPRWAVVYSHDGDLTGVVVDDYGCRDARLTDDPHTTPPGVDHQDGTVGGVLDGGAAILRALGVGRSS